MPRVEVYKAGKLVRVHVCPNQIAATVYAMRARAGGFSVLVFLSRGESLLVVS